MRFRRACDRRGRSKITAKRKTTGAAVARPAKWDFHQPLRKRRDRPAPISRRVQHGSGRLGVKAKRSALPRRPVEGLDQGQEPTASRIQSCQASVGMKDLNLLTDETVSNLMIRFANRSQLTRDRTLAIALWGLQRRNPPTRCSTSSGGAGWPCLRLIGRSGTKNDGLDLRRHEQTVLATRAWFAWFARLRSFCSGRQYQRRLLVKKW